MSADNWAVCPKCKLELENIVKRPHESRKSYGKVTSDEYLSLISGISNKETEEQENIARRP